jgi:hypothetical protein
MLQLDTTKVALKLVVKKQIPTNISAWSSSSMWLYTYILGHFGTIKQ